VSQENVQIAERFRDAFRHGDWKMVAAIADPDIAVRADRRWPEQRMYGREAWVGFMRDMSDLWGTDLRAEEIVDLGDRLLTHSRWIIRGHHSGLGGDFCFSSITTFREGRFVFIEFFIEREEALKAVGLEE
jgi:hypothetical protein